MRDRLDCSPEPSSVRAARLFVVDKLQEWRCDDLVDSAALVTSELATNAVVHTGLPYSVHVERRPDGVRVEVIDLRHDLPLQPPAPPLEGEEGWDGRDDGPHVDTNHLFSGLGMVDAVATRWGAEAMPGNGKKVWFELVTNRSSRSRPRVTDLHDLRDAVDDAWSNAPLGALSHDAHEAHHLSRRPRRRVGRWVLLGAVIVVVVVGGLILLSE
jgi:hypothetical protein